MVSVVWCGNMTVIKLFVGKSALHGADRARLLIDDLTAHAASRPDPAQVSKRKLQKKKE
jgi:hypothetical protein